MTEKLGKKICLRYGRCFLDYLRKVEDPEDLREILVSHPRAAVSDATRLWMSGAAAANASTVGDTLLQGSFERSNFPQKIPLETPKDNCFISLEFFPRII